VKIGIAAKERKIDREGTRRDIRRGVAFRMLARTRIDALELYAAIRLSKDATPGNPYKRLPVTVSGRRVFQSLIPKTIAGVDKRVG
jgi:hypothetical protein